MCVVNDLSSRLNILLQCRSVELVCVPDENESHSISEMINNKTKYSMECFLSILYHACETAGWYFSRISRDVEDYFFIETKIKSLNKRSYL